MKRLIFCILISLSIGYIAGKLSQPINEAQVLKYFEIPDQDDY